MVFTEAQKYLSTRGGEEGVSLAFSSSVLLLRGLVAD